MTAFFHQSSMLDEVALIALRGACVLDCGFGFTFEVCPPAPSAAAARDSPGVEPEMTLATRLNQCMAGSVSFPLSTIRFGNAATQANTSAERIAMSVFWADLRFDAGLLLLIRLGSRLAPHAIEIDPELGMLARTSYVNRDLRAGAILL